MDVTDIYRIVHPAIAKCTFFSAAYGTFSKIDHVLGHKACLRKYMKIEITPCILSDHSMIKTRIQQQKNSRKYSNSWRLNNTLLHDQWIIEKVRDEIKKFLELIKMKAKPIMTYGTDQRQC
jgi:hypothetical protein